MHIPKWLIATAGLLFVALIASVAFFIGRQTSQPTAPPTAVSELVQEAPSVKDPAISEASGGVITSPITASTSGIATTQAPPSTASAPLSSTSATVAAVNASPATAESRARVSAYFTQMDALQSGGPGGDPETFANTILQGATSGDFSGLDDLVRTAGNAERRAAALQPPAECAEYHRMAVTLLQDSRAMMTGLRDGLKRNDTEALTSMGAAAQSMKARADALAASEKALRARFGL